MSGSSCACKGVDDDFYYANRAEKFSTLYIGSAISLSLSLSLFCALFFKDSMSMYKYNNFVHVEAYTSAGMFYI